MKAKITELERSYVIYRNGKGWAYAKINIKKNTKKDMERAKKLAVEEMKIYKERFPAGKFTLELQEFKRTRIA